MYVAEEDAVPLAPLVANHLVLDVDDPNGLVADQNDPESIQTRVGEPLVPTLMIVACFPNET